MRWTITEEGNYESAETFQKYGRAKEAANTFAKETGGALLPLIFYRRRAKPSTYYLVLLKSDVERKKYRYKNDQFEKDASSQEQTMYQSGTFVLWERSDSSHEYYIYNIRKDTPSGTYVGEYWPVGEKRFPYSAHAFSPDGPFYTWPHWMLQHSNEKDRAWMREMLQERVKDHE